MRPAPTISAVAFAALLSLASSAVAIAHAELVGTDPVDGATITTPYTLMATFSEALTEPSNIVVRNSGGEEVARGLPDPEAPETLTADLTRLPPGEYVANWTIRAADGHTDRGDFNFSVGTAATAAPTPTEAPNGGQGGQTGNSGDLLIALVVAAIGLAGIGTFIVMRIRR